MGKKQKKAGAGKEKTLRKTAKSEEKQRKREDKKLKEEDDIDAILAKIQKEDSKKVAVHIDENVPAPSPRCNASVTINPTKDNELIIYGGEYYNGVKDLWKFDLTTNTWEQLNLKGAPSPRSGHRMWQEVKPTPGQLWPSARSAFQFAATGDEIFMYGGYFKDHTSVDKEVSEKGVVLADMWSLDPRTFEWNKVKKIGLPPGPRAGFSMCVHKKRVVFFGGVVDSEDTGDLMRSIFLNEMYGFQMDNRRWYPMELRKAKVAKPKVQNTVYSISPASMNCFTRGRGGKSSGPSLSDQPGSDTLAKVEETAEVADMDIDEKAELAEQMKGTLLQENDSVEDEIVRPCGRINASMVVGKDTLYLYGGMMEIGDREITLDDLYTLDLNKLDSWKCLIEATEADWVEEEDDDDDEDDEDDDEDDEEDDDDEDDDDEMAETDKAESSAAPSAAEAAAAVLRGGGKKLSRKQRKAEIDRIRAELGLADAQRTPLAGETLRDFFNRTLMYWQEAAYAHTQHTGKELRKDGFDLAESRYKELKPVLDELEKLEKDQKAEEEEDASRLLSMKKSKEKAKAGSRR
ncbi:hypothetical protein AXG93_436s1270 [Marchantia polymorpha subsp. ruderalis]|uniref:DUF4110 domain-containing protein n=1 Tax=Marchantia polymorpha subsp. ruderalis TaxID=1480154 RepID=A0A176VER9_MARPO|nr:hypothetical protein AXG93_436s1270 [Marchantia polymorpha subsp. ruderalis]